jgi:hypothetical protein
MAEILDRRDFQKLLDGGSVLQAAYKAKGTITVPKSVIVDRGIGRRDVNDKKIPSSYALG